MPIVPDTKDWTWVLERRCPECGFDASATTHGDVPNLIRDNANAWRVILSEDDRLVKNRPRDDRWSALEYGCHVRDVYRIGNYRLHRMLTEDDPLYPNWNQDSTAIEDRYSEQDPQQVLRQLGNAAEELAKRLEQVAGNQWQRSGRRSDGASFTVSSFAKYIIHDPVHHVFDVNSAFQSTSASS